MNGKTCFGSARRSKPKLHGLSAAETHPHTLTFMAPVYLVLDRATLNSSNREESL